MWAALIAVLVKDVAPVLIKQVVLPEILRIVKKKHAENSGEWPTEEEIFEELKKTIATGREEGQEFLARTEKPVRAPRDRN